MKEDNINILISNCYDIFTQAVKRGVFPGAAMAVSLGNPEQRVRLKKTYGYLDYSQEKAVSEKTFYDLASLTKPLATTLAILVLLQEGLINLSNQIKDIFPQTDGSFFSQMTIRDILCHSAGFPSHRPYYSELVTLEKQKKKEALLKLLLFEKPDYEPGTKSVYSDLGFMLLGLVIEKKSGLEPSVFFKEKIAAPLGLAEKIHYLPVMRQKDKNYAPTEDCLFRKRVLCGEVSDENAGTLEGLAGHAGLFGNIGGVLEMTENLLDQWQGRVEHPSYRAHDLQTFLLRQAIPGSTWALGFDTPAKTGSSGGRYLAETSVGHLGFTGTSFWIDPTRDLVMVLLSNRVHPTRENNLIKQFRPLFHDTVIESLGLT